MPNFEGFLLTALGAGVNAATVDLLDRNTTTPVRATTTTDADGYWTISHATQGRFDVRITSGSDVLWFKYDTSGQMTELEVATLKIRNPADTFHYDIVPAAITAARTLNLPLITGTDTLVTLALAQEFTARKDFNAVPIRFTGGVAATDAQYEVLRNADGTNLMQLNVPTGAHFEFSVNDVQILKLNAAQADIIRTKHVQLEPFSMVDSTDCATGDGKAWLRIPPEMDGMDLVGIDGVVRTAGVTRTMDVQVHNLTQAVDMLTTKLTWDSGEAGTDTAATPAVIDTANDDVAAYDLLRIDYDAVQTTAAKGSLLSLYFRLP